MSFQQQQQQQQQEIHVTGVNVYSDYSADVIFDDSTCIVFGPGLDAFVRIRRLAGSVGVHNRLAIDMQHHFTSHALSQDLAHVGAALKIISTISPRQKFIRSAIRAATAADDTNNGGNDDGILLWKAASVSLEEFIAPAINDVEHVRVIQEEEEEGEGQHQSTSSSSAVTVISIASNATLRLSPNGTFCDITWPSRAYESDGRSIQFDNSIKSILCVAHQQRFPVGTIIDSVRKFNSFGVGASSCGEVPKYSSESVDHHNFWAPLACWAPLLRVALQKWKDLGGLCSDSVLQFLGGGANNNNNNSETLLQVTCNFPPPIPPKVSPVVASFPRLTMEDAATLLASTSDRLHCLPIHDRVHSSCFLCVSWCAGERCCWMSPETGISRSLIFEDMSCLHIEASVPNVPMAILHIQNAIQQQQQRQKQQQQQQQQHQNQQSKLPEPNSIVAAAKVYSWEGGSLDRTSKHAPLLPSVVVLPAGFSSCSCPDTIPLFRSYFAGGAVAGEKSADPRRGRYFQGEVEFMASLIETARLSQIRAAKNMALPTSALGIVPTNTFDPSNSSSSSSSLDIKKRMNNNNNNTTATHLNSSSSMIYQNNNEGIGAVKTSSTIPGIGVFTAYQDGTVRCVFDDRTMLTLRHENNNTNNNNNLSHLTGDNIFVTALDQRAVSNRFRAASCTPQHPMYPYLQYAMPFMRFSMLSPQDRFQLAQDPVVMSSSATYSSGGEEGEEQQGVPIASSLERVVAKNNLALQQHQYSADQRRKLLDKCETL